MNSRAGVWWAVGAVVLLVAACGGGPTSATKANQLVVTTDRGAVGGLVANGMREFLGIPYAAPPVASLRWKPPQDVASWSGVRSATTFGPHCAQPGGASAAVDTNEDCLYLNVYTPQTQVSGKSYPVMFWIHGGSLKTGSGDSFRPTALLAHGVVVVTINYRLGLFGFLAHPALTAEEGTSDFGFLDQIAALTWVQHNIGAFGGSKANVTIFGESAGGYSVQGLLVAPLAKGLFSKAIDESGSYALRMANPSPTAAAAAGQQAAVRIGCPDQTLTCMRSAPASAIVTANTASTTYAPVDGKVLPMSFVDAFTSGSFTHVPVMIGTNHDEWSLFVAGAEIASHNPLTADRYLTTVAATIQAPLDTAQARAAAYPLSAYPTPSNALTALGTDAIFACNALSIVRSIGSSTPTYQYEFNDQHPPDTFGGSVPLSFAMGAYHGSEIGYIFDLVRTPGGTPPAKGATQQKLSAAMVGYWTQFAKTGNPNASGTPTWPTYSKSHEAFQSLVPPTPATRSDFYSEHLCNLWGLQ